VNFAARPMDAMTTSNPPAPRDPFSDDALVGKRILDGAQHLASPSTFAELGALTPEDWAEAKRVVRERAVLEKAQRRAG